VRERLDARQHGRQRRVAGRRGGDRTAGVLDRGADVDEREAHGGELELQRRAIGARRAPERGLQAPRGGGVASQHALDAGRPRRIGRRGPQARRVVEHGERRLGLPGGGQRPAPGGQQLAPAQSGGQRGEVALERVARHRGAGRQCPGRVGQHGQLASDGGGERPRHLAGGAARPGQLPHHERLPAPSRTARSATAASATSAATARAASSASGPSATCPPSRAASSSVSAAAPGRAAATTTPGARVGRRSTCSSHSSDASSAQCRSSSTSA
jgi:hypothetical protein